MTIKLPKNVTAINPNPENDGIQLPFTAPVFWWANGDKKMKQVGGVQYYGGWNGNDDDVETAVSENGALPDGFLLEVRTGNDGDYAVYSSRTVTVVPIKARKRWKDGRSHSQTLCLLAVKNGDVREAWGPVVLSAKGYTTDRLTKAFASWVSHVRDVRAKIAPDVPAWYFWQAIGTIGDYEEEVVGKVKKSPITPVKCYLPKITEKVLETLYVGDETAAMLSSLSEQAQEWASDKGWIEGKEIEVVEDEIEYHPLNLEEEPNPFD